MNRRDFLKQTMALSATACCAAAWGATTGQSAWAQGMGGTGNTLLLLNQFGGNDMLNSFAVPYTVAAYYDRRPTIAIPAGNVLQTANGIGLNPAMPSLHQLFLDGDVAIIQACGDPVSNRSHFTSQEYFSRGIIDPTSAHDQRGWVGRTGDLYLTDTPFNTFGIGVGQQTDFRSDRGTNRPIVTSRLSSFGINGDFVSSRENAQRRAIVEALSQRERLLTGRKKSARDAQKALYDGVATIQQVINDYSSSVTYPNSTVGRYFLDSAMLIQSSSVATRLLYGGVGGWDTHSNQVGGHENRLGDIDLSLNALVTDLKAMGRWSQTAICIFTEFGRINFENGSAGTDHAKGSTMVVIGGDVNGGVYGPTPTDSQLRNNRYIDMDIDFRNVFSRLVNWLGFNPAPVFPESYSQVNVPFI